LPSDARVLVAELVPAVIAWNRNPAYGLAHDALLDPRVELLEGDVTDALRRNPAAFDAVMMDVDNGADAFTTSSNAWLYQPAGVSLAIASLRERGRLAYWSADDDQHFATMLRHAGLDVTTNRVRAHATTGPNHTLLVAQRRSSDAAAGVRRATADGQGVRRVKG
jgi:spermidine synthase